MNLITLIEWCFHFSGKGEQEASRDDRGWLYHTQRPSQIGIDFSHSSFWVIFESLTQACLEERRRVVSCDRWPVPASDYADLPCTASTTTPTHIRLALDPCPEGQS